MTDVVNLTNHLRGHQIYERNGTWFYLDNNEPTATTWRTRACGKCGQHNTPEGHDACLGTLLGVVNACCGHGVDSEAYVVLDDGCEFRGKEAIYWFRGKGKLK